MANGPSLSLIGTFDIRDYGALGDGVHDDQAAIQAALNAAAAAGGGTVYVPAGTWIVGPGGTDVSDGALELGSNVTLQGAGMGLSVLKLADNVAHQINGFVRTPYGVVTHDVALLDLTLDGNRANNTAKVNAFLTGVAPGSTQTVSNVTVNHVEAMNFTGYGFDPHERTTGLTIENSVAHGNGLDGFVADFQIDGVFRNNLSYGNDRHGFNIVTSTTNFLLDGNVAHDNGGTGITIQRGSDPQADFTNHVTVQGGSVYNNGAAGIEVKLADWIALQGIAIHDNGKAGVSILGSSHVTVDANSIVNNGLGAASGYYDAVVIGDQLDTYSGATFYAAAIAVTNNTIASTGAIRPAYGIAEESAHSPLASFTGNSIDGMKYGDISMDGVTLDQSGTPLAGTTFNASAYGALGDGIHDDTAAIQAAIDAAYAAGGGTVSLAAGTYIVSGTGENSDGCLLLRDNVTLQGAGLGQTILKVAATTVADITGVVRTPYNEVTHDVGLMDLTIDGNRANTTGKVDGFFCGVAPGDPRQDYNITVDGVEILNCSGYGFDPHEQTVNITIANSVAHGNGLDGFVADWLINSRFENNIAYGNDRHGFNITTSSVSLDVTNSTAYDNGSAGLIVQRGSEDIVAPTGITITGGSFHDNAREGIYLKIASDVQILGSDVFGNGRQGIRIDGSTDVTIDGATVHDNSQSAAGIYDEIRLAQFDDTLGASGRIFDTTGVNVVNSTISALVAGQSHYGIYESPQVTGINGESGNTITGMTAGDTYFAPQLIHPATDQAVTVGNTVSYDVPPSSFVDGDSTFVLSAKLASGDPLPSWLHFDPATGHFSGTVPGNGSYSIVVQARDADGLKDTTTFQLTATGGVAGITVNGTIGDDSLTGGAGPDTIAAGDGNDLIAGLFGSDSIDGGTGIDTVTYAASNAAVTVSLLTGTGSGGDAEGDVLANVENLVGSAFADSLTGDANANVLNGGAGADTMAGGNGNDTYYVDNAGDVVVELDSAGLGGTDTVLASVSYALSANVENLTLLGTANIDATGNSKANVLTGNAGNNVLDGDGGSDTLIGGLGNDTYVVNVTGDVLVEDANGGTDTVRSSISWTLADQFENLTLTGVNPVNGTGNAVANVLVGNDGANKLFGMGGNDTMSGGLGNDTLDGGNGVDLAVYSGTRAAATVVRNVDHSLSVSTSADGSDVLKHVEQVRFDDGLASFTFARPGLAVVANFNQANGWTTQDAYARHVADVNGDGYADVVGFGQAGTWASFGSASGVFSAPALVGPSFGQTTGWTSDNQYHRELADVNGDGRADVIGFGQAGTWVSLARADGTFGNPAIGVTQFGQTQGWTSQTGYARVTGDVNGDGKADIVGFGQAGTWVSLSNGDGTFAPVQFAGAAFGVNQGWNNDNSYHRTLADVNGDGKADIVGFGIAGTWVSLSNGDGTFGAANLASASFGANQGWTSNDAFPHFATDVNHDGLADLIGFGIAGTWVAFGQTGGTFSEASLDVADFGKNQNWTSDNVNHHELADMNHDGLPDIVGFANSGVVVGYNQGDFLV